MIEANKMLHLRGYLTFFVRTQLRLPRCETTSRLPRRGGYVSDCMHLRNLQPEIYIAACNRTYGTTVPESSRSDVVDHKLMSFCDDVKKGQVSADGLKKIIGLCNASDYQLPHDVGVLLLKCCGNLLPDLEVAERDHLAGQVWDLAKKNGRALTLEYYNTLLGINEENSTSVNPQKFLANMNVEPNENTYRLLLNAATKVGNSEHLWDILSVIKDKSVAIYEEAINALVQICVSKNNIAEVEQMLTLMQEAKLPMDKAYTELACGYARLGDIPNLVKILNEQSQNNANLLRIIKILSMSNNSRHIPVVLNLLMTSIPAIEPEISKMITELIRADQFAGAYTIINYLVANDATKDIVQNVVNSFINELIISNASSDDIVKYAKNFVDSGWNRQILTDVAEIGLKLGREKLCLAIFQVMRNKNIEIRPHYYWPLLLRAYYDKGEAEIYSLIKSMVNEGVEIDFDTLLHYVYPYVNTANPIITLQRLQSNDMPPTIAFTPLLSFLLQRNRLQDVKSLCTHHVHYRVYYKELIKPLVYAYLATKDEKNCVLLLTTFSQGRDFIGLFLRLLIKDEYPIYIEDLQLLLEELKECQAKISQEDATIFENRLQKKNFNLTSKVANLIQNLVDPSMDNSINTLLLKYMTTKELTYHLVELKSNNAYFEKILNKLFVMYCMDNNFKKAEEIKREYDACQYQWQANMKAMLFELYLKQNKLNEAEALLSDFQADRIKIIMYATALVKADQLTKAFDVIDTFNPIDTKSDSHGYCCTLLQVLAQSQRHVHTADMLNLLLRRNYCQVTMDLLKPLVAIPLEHNNILDAVDVLTECAQKYNQAPLALEVLTMLLEQKYSSKLDNVNKYIEQVYDIVATIRSVNVANTVLAIALAMLNKTEKLQTLLQNHELSTNSLVYYINNVKSINMLDGLQNIFKVADANHMNQDTICETLLFAYSKIGDCNRALELWKIMCTKNIEPSEQFEKNFIQFLVSNKVPLPKELDKIKEKY